MAIRSKHNERMVQQTKNMNTGRLPLRSGRRVALISAWLLAVPACFSGQLARAEDKATVEPPPNSPPYSQAAARFVGVYARWEPQRAPMRFGKLVSDQVRELASRDGGKRIGTCHESRYATGTRVDWCESQAQGEGNKFVNEVEIVSPRVAAGGVRVGDSARAVRKVYGAPQDAQAPVWVYAHDGGDVQFTILGGRVRKVLWRVSGAVA